MSDELNESQLYEVSGGEGQKFAFYTVMHGDRLSEVAHHFRTTGEIIMSINPIITDRNFLRTGWVLKVPDNR